MFLYRQNSIRKTFLEKKKLEVFFLRKQFLGKMFLQKKIALGKLFSKNKIWITFFRKNVFRKTGIREIF